MSASQTSPFFSNIKSWENFFYFVADGANGLIEKKIILHPIHIWQDLFMLRAKRAETWEPRKYCIGSTMRQTIDKEFLFDQTYVCNDYHYTSN